MQVPEENTLENTTGQESYAIEKNKNILLPKPSLLRSRHYFDEPEQFCGLSICVTFYAY